MAHVVSIVLNIAEDKTAEFEAGFREHELPIWQDMLEKGTLLRAALTPLSISTVHPDGVKQYALTVILRDFAAHSAHDDDPRFTRWNTLADAFQPEEPYVFGGDALIEVGGS